jgi:N,N'-diacetyllegionaminate synthase
MIFSESNDFPYIIAEIGGNHEGDFNYAKKLANLAIEAQVDCIKYQVYSGETLVNGKLDAARVKHFNKFELSRSQYEYLATMCHENNIEFSASVWDKDSLKWLDKYLSFYKIGSGDLTNYEIIYELINRQKPILLSTGLATLQEIADTVDFIHSKSQFYTQYGSLGLLQCTSMYPIPDEEANLLVMNKLASIYNHPVGYSDHTKGTYAVEVAAIMGASIIEIHFTDDTSRSFRDHGVSFTKDDILNFKKKFTIIQAIKGTEIKEPTKSEISSGHINSFRRGIFLKNDKNRGEIIESDDLISLRPDKGISANQYYELLGKTLMADMKAYEPLSIKLFE